MIAVDTNILFSYFWIGSSTKKLLDTAPFRFISPEEAFAELRKYKNDICKKTKITHTQFEELLVELELAVIFVSKKFYEQKMDHAKMISPDVGDVPFFALCLEKQVPLWTQDKKLQSQEHVAIIVTQELVEFLL